MNRNGKTKHGAAVLGGLFILFILILLGIPRSPSQISGDSISQSAAVDFKRDGRSKLIGFNAQGRTFASRNTASAFTSPAKAKAQVNAFFARHKLTLGVSSPDVALKAGRIKREGTRFSHVRYHQTYKGLPVFGMQAMVQLNNRRQVISGTVDFYEGLSLDTTPSVSLAQARDIAKLAWKENHSETPEARIVRSYLTVLPMSIIQGIKSSDVRLAWIVIGGSALHPQTPEDTYYIDAKSGELLKREKMLISAVGTPSFYRMIPDCSSYILGYPTPNTCYVNAWAATTPAPAATPGGPTPTPYVLGRGEPKPPRGPFPYNYNPTVSPLYGSVDVDRDYELLGTIGDYVFNTYNRDGPNYHGGMVMTPIPTPTAYPAGTPYRSGGPVGRIYSNVHYDGIASTGICPDAFFAPQSGSSYPSFMICHGLITPDVVGHEFAHSLAYFDIDNGAWYRPAGNNYSGEPGALQESFGDVFGAAIEQQVTGVYDWKIGRWQNNPQGVYPSSNAPWYRDVANPGSVLNSHLSNLPYPDRYRSANFYCGSADASGVHHNSTVPSKAFSLLADGGDFNGCHINGIGMAAAQLILYNAWDFKFVYNESFNQAYNGYISACNDAFGTTNPSYCTELTKALQAVELNQVSPCVVGSTEVAPACAVHKEGTVYTTYNQPNLRTTTFAPGEHIWLRGSGSVPNSTLQIYFTPHTVNPALWSAISGSPQATSAVDSSGTSATLIAQASTLGAYDLLVDGNGDGFYQPWADTLINITVAAPVNGDGQCYRGESDATSENCHVNTGDCACQPGLECVNLQGSLPNPRYGCVSLYNSPS